MGNLLFSPSGTTSPKDFMAGATFLIAVTLVINLLAVVNFFFNILGLVGLVFIWCWVVLWVKRYRFGGKSGWMCLIPIVLFIVLTLITDSIITPIFTDPVAQAEIKEIMDEAVTAGDLTVIFDVAKSGAGVSKIGLIVSMIVQALISYATAFGFNKAIPAQAEA